MGRQALLVDYQWCTGCHSCELACQMKNELPPDQFGIKINDVGPWQIAPKQWQYAYFPVLTKQCDLCADRQAAGKLPSCVQHCQSNCIQIMDAGQAAEIAGRNPHCFMMTL